MNDMFKILVDIHEEFEQIDKEDTDNVWFDDINSDLSRVFLDRPVQVSNPH